MNASNSAPKHGSAKPAKLCDGCKSPSFCVSCPYNVKNKALKEKEDFQKLYTKFKEAESTFLKANDDFANEWKRDTSAKLTANVVDFLVPIYRKGETDRAVVTAFYKKQSQISKNFEKDMHKLTYRTLKPIREEMEMKAKKHGILKKWFWGLIPYAMEAPQ